MIENNNFPWYLQQTETFSTLYYAFFPIAEAASPLGIGDAFNVDAMTGKMLYRLGVYWGMSGSNALWDGLIYDLDNWSEIKTWTGGLKDLGETMYRNLIKAKAYANGNLYSLKTLKEIISRIMGTNQYTATVTENTMEITINLTASRDVITTFIEMRAFDLSFIGKPTGIKVLWNYNYTD